jgi:hypothetical protein
VKSESRQYLLDAELNAQLAEYGYVVIPFLNVDDVEKLVATFDNAHQAETAAFYASSHHESSDFRKKMSAAISEVLEPHSNRVFNSCKMLGASFISKSKDEASHLQPHQDWNIVDEREFRSFNVWIPLVDLNEQNGAIEVLPKSHNWVRGIRHSSIGCAYAEVHDMVWENMQPLYLKAGEALIYDHALLHASKANKTDQKRIACASGVMPEEAQMFFYWNENGTIEKYDSNPEFFMTENIFSQPSSLSKVYEFEYNLKLVDSNLLHQFLGKEPPVIEDIKIESPTVEVADGKPAVWEVYTPMNILREINYRLRSKK